MIKLIKKQDRIERDKKVEIICEKAKIKLIKFHVHYPNEKNYIKKRVKKYILNNK